MQQNKTNSRSVGTYTVITEVGCLRKTIVVASCDTAIRYDIFRRLQLIAAIRYVISYTFRQTDVIY